MSNKILSYQISVKLLFKKKQKNITNIYVDMLIYPNCKSSTLIRLYIFYRHDNHTIVFYTSHPVYYFVANLYKAHITLGNSLFIEYSFLNVLNVINNGAISMNFSMSHDQHTELPMWVCRWKSWKQITLIVPTDGHIETYKAFYTRGQIKLPSEQCKVCSQCTHDNTPLNSS